MNKRGASVWGLVLVFVLIVVNVVLWQAGVFDFSSSQNKTTTPNQVKQTQSSGASPSAGKVDFVPQTEHEQATVSPTCSIVLKPVKCVVTFTVPHSGNSYTDPTVTIGIKRESGSGDLQKARFIFYKPGNSTKLIFDWPLSLQEGASTEITFSDTDFSGHAVELVGQTPSVFDSAAFSGSGIELCSQSGVPVQCSFAVIES